MVIICEKVGSTKSIRIGRRYQVLSQTDTRYRIVNENGVEANYCKTLFIEGGETGNERRARQNLGSVDAQVAPAVAIPVVPVAPPIRVIDEINAETSAEINDEEHDDEKVEAFIRLKVKFMFGNNLNFDLNSGNIFSVYCSEIGCGIRDISGLNGLMLFTKSIKSKLSEFIRLKTEANVFKLAEGFDIDGLVKDIYEAFLQDIISKFQGDVDGIPKAGLLNFSTNVNNNGSIDELLLEIFDEKSDSSIEFVNPNGGNTCKIWSFKTAE